MKRLTIFAAVMVAGLVAAIAQPANAGGHERWRSCGGHAYEGCDGIERGPYARQGGYGFRGQPLSYGRSPKVRVCKWHRRNFFGPGGVYLGSRTVETCGWQ